MRSVWSAKIVSSASAESAEPACDCAQAWTEDCIVCTAALAWSPNSWYTFGNAIASVGPRPPGLNPFPFAPSEFCVYSVDTHRSAGNTVTKEDTDLLLEVLPDGLQTIAYRDAERTKHIGITNS